MGLGVKSVRARGRTQCQCECGRGSGSAARDPRPLARVSVGVMVMDAQLQLMSNKGWQSTRLTDRPLRRELEPEGWSARTRREAHPHGELSTTILVAEGKYKDSRSWKFGYTLRTS